MDLRLSGRRALVSGGSKGIGFASGKLLAQEGCDVVLVSRSPADLERAKAEIEKAAPGRRIETEACDLSQDEVPGRLVERYGERIDILVNNAGAIPGGTLGDIDQARWRAAWELKLFGYIGMTREFYAPMAKRKSGVIVNVIGAAGERMSASYIAGSTANAALMAFTRAIGAAAPADGVRVVGINPGPVSTGRLETLQRGRAKSLLGDPERWRETLADLPFRRAGTPDEIAAMVAFLASDLSGYTTGTIVTIDGGMSHKG
ncbi:NAD(P)-dependent dehydrogenase, short-chain alcohol dehydrogenase family [Rhizobiales bacterium GAS188]|nr:NAD(P)-dependent dehydrogenase, short-chain alcohol dehydrogenase family [Rhizobiales bacterium GAS188]